MSEKKIDFCFGQKSFSGSVGKNVNHPQLLKVE
jgi:hypothetical protein